MLHKFAKFTKNKTHLIHLYKSQVRGILEYCSTVWHSSLTGADSDDIERVQKAALRLIMANNGKQLPGLQASPSTHETG